MSTSSLHLHSNWYVPIILAPYPRRRQWNEKEEPGIIPNKYGPALQNKTYIDTKDTNQRVLYNGKKRIALYCITRGYVMKLWLHIIKSEPQNN